MDKKLVIIQLTGGNDGLNTLVPFRNDVYYRSRPTLHIPKNNVLSISDDIGFSKENKQLHNLYKEGKLLVLNNVGYPEPNRSHFSSMDVWQSAFLDSRKHKSGWIGRFLDVYGKAYPNGLGAVEIGNILSLALKGEKEKGVAISNITDMYTDYKDEYILRLIGRELPETQNDSLQHIYSILNKGKQSFDKIYHDYTNLNPTLAFSGAAISTDLEAVSEMIVSKSETSIYYLSHGSFDTHINQMGIHMRLLSQLNKALEEFLTAIESYGSLDDICIFIFSEFGRRVSENASSGTDHGAANNCYIISNQLQQAGIYNQMDNLTNLIEGDVPYEIDFRSVYSSLLRQWLNVEPSQILQKSYPELSLFNQLFV